MSLAGRAPARAQRAIQGPPGGATLQHVAAAACPRPGPEPNACPLPLPWLLAVIDTDTYRASNKRDYHANGPAPVSSRTSRSGTGGSSGGTSGGGLTGTTGSGGSYP